MRYPYAIRRRSRSLIVKRNRRLLLEQLERRTLLDGSNVFAAFAGELVTGETSDTIRVHLTPGNFTIGGGHATLGFVVKPGEGSALSPNPINILSVAPGSVPIVTQTLLADGSSLVLAKLKLGDHDLRITGNNNTKGSWQLQVFLAGDVNGDFLVNAIDNDLIQDVVKGKSASLSFMAAADANRDGQITGFDLAQASQNKGIATTLRALTVTAHLDPDSDTGVVGDGVVNHSPITIVGHTVPSTSLTFDKDGDGFDDGLATASSSLPNNFAFVSNLVEGPNTLRVRTGDSFGQVAFTSTVVTLDTTLPAAPTFDLAPVSDSVPVGDGQTIEEQVTLIGQSEPLATIVLNPLALSTIADNTGRFSFSSVHLALGPNAFVARATDAAGNVSSFSKTIVRLNPENDPPVVVVGLANDSAPGGTTNSDGITADPALAGRITDASRIASVRVGLDAMSPNAFVEAITDLQSDGSLHLSRSRLQQLFGVTLTDGSHQFHIRATDEAGNVSGIQSVALVLDTTPPIIPSVELSAGSYTSAVGAQTTSAARVTLVGQTDPNLRVSLNDAAAFSLASNKGDFFFPDVSLSVGDNLFSLSTVDVAGNASFSSNVIHRVDQPAQVDPALLWNAVALEAVRMDATAPPIASRFLAMMQLAVFDTISSVEGTPGYYVNLPPPAPVSIVAAASAAAEHVLEYAYPAQRSTFQAALSNVLAGLPAGPAQTDELAYGRQIADAIIAIRSTDGWDRFVDYVPGSDPGQWQQTAPMYDVALLPQWAQLEPFAMTGPEQFRPDGPPSLGSSEYAAALNEVKQLGRATGSTRTADQTQIARFWGDGPGTYTPPGHWNQIATQILQQDGSSLTTSARLLAQLNVALADAAIVAWDAKFHENFWRPVTAVQNADTDGNDATSKDSDWQSFLITPPFPEFVSGHSTFSGAAAEVLSSVLGERSFSITSYGLPGVTRSFNSFTAAAEEAGRSRIYGGIHYEFSNQDGQAAGRELAQLVLDRFNFSSDTQPPTIQIKSPEPNSAFNHAVTVTGTVLDNLSGVASLQYQLDEGPLVSVNFSAQGQFAIPLNLPLDGSSDGRHTFSIFATDSAGNSDPVPKQVEFTVTTIAPVVSITSPEEGDTITANSSLQGIAQSGASVVAVSYAFDGGSAVPLLFDPATGSFDNSLDLSHLGPGVHTLSVTARDAAGNSSARSITVSLDARIPFTLGEVTPAPGSGDVGPTFRPQIHFSRAVNASTLNSNNLYAIDTTGAKLPATIVPAADGSFAWLFFQSPMPGASTITVHVEGQTILAAADSQPLDAEGDGAAGGTFTYQFSTVSLVPLMGTTLSGKVVDPGPDYKPMTFDDIRAGADGTLHTADDVFLNPIAGVKVHILGLENQAVFTDAQGKFSFSAVPSGNVKLVLDGRTATNVPAGFFFPEMVMDLEIDVGRANTVMGTMGSREEKAANRDRPEVYLPRLRTDILRTVDSTSETVIGVDAGSAPNLTAEQRAQLRITVQPGSLIGPNGQHLSSGQVGISTVPPELVRDMLPQGIMQLAATITIQAPGVTRFAEPIRLTFPNLYGAAPGEKLNFYSFDHDTGLLVIEGTVTVSEDGLSATTDPGHGITKPGWHGVTPPFSLTQSQPQAASTKYVQVTGAKLGDVIRVDLKGALPGFTEFQSRTIRNGVIAKIDHWDDLLRTNGVLYFAPEIPVSPDRFYRAPVTFQSDFKARNPNGDLVDVVVQFKQVAPGFTKLFLGNSVGDGAANGKIDVYRVQQRLRWLGFPSSSGLWIPVSGDMTPTTIEAIRLFQATTLRNGNRNIVGQPGFVVRNDATDEWLSAIQAPVWSKLDDQGQGWTNIDHDNDDWGASWSFDAVNAAGVSNSTGVRLHVNDVSHAGGGPFSPHQGHQSGLDVDVDTPSFDSLDVNRPFYRIHVLPDGNGSLITYIAASTAEDPFGDSHIIGSSQQGYQPIEIVANSSLDGLTHGQAWDNKEVLEQIARYLVDNSDPDVKYNLGVIVQHIEAFRTSPFVSSIFYNDPRTWSTDGFVKFEPGHGGHFHVNISPPSALVQSGSSQVQTMRNGADPSAHFRFVFASGFELSGVTNEFGFFSVVLPSNSNYTLTVYETSTRLSATYVGRTNDAGVSTNVGTLLLDQFGGTDADGDGLPDIGELAIGTSSAKGDSDGDGVKDAAEIALGLDPLDGGIFPVNVVASLNLQGEAKEVVAEGSILDPQGQTAYVATGSYGLAIVDASRFQQPIVLGQLDLPGDAIDVAIDSQLRIAAVASNSGGLHLVDVSDRTQPVLLRTLSVVATQVEVVDGIAFVAVGSELQAFDLLTGEKLQGLDLAGATITGLVRERSMLYTMDSARALRAIDISSGAMVAGGTLIMPNGGGKLFVGGGIVYAAAASGGFATANVGDPNALTLISGVDSTNIAGAAIAANGSGLAIAVGQSGGVNAVDIVNVSDPTNTAAFGTRFSLSQPPLAVTLAAGLAFIADGTAGLQVVNFVPFDGFGQPPTVAIAAVVTDLDTTIPGLQVLEGATVPVAATVSDDVQVRNVELLVNGQVVRNDVSFPFDLSAVLPSISANGSDLVTIQVRVTDTGGNVGLSELVSVQLLSDIVAPTISSINPTDGSQRGQAFRTVIIDFSEPMDKTTVHADSVQLVGPGGTVTPTNVQFRKGDRTVQFTYPTLSGGGYQVVIDATAITDRVGNALGTGQVTSSFSIAQAKAVWINPLGGFWDDATNWNTGFVPATTDDVVIDIATGATITYRQGDTEIRSLSSNNPFTIFGGTLTVAQTVQVNNTFTLNGGTLKDATVLAGTGGQGITVVTANESGHHSANRLLNVTIHGDLTLSATSAEVQIEGSTTFANAHLTGNSSRLRFGPGAVLTGNVLFEGPTSSSRAVEMIEAGTLTIGPTGSIRTAVGFGGSGTVGGGSIRPAMNLVNQGTIESSVNRAITVSPATLTNQGTLTASGGGRLSLGGAWSSTGVLNVNAGTLDLGGTFTTAGLNLTAFSRTGGVVELSGTLNNTGNTLSLNAATGSWNLRGGTISGGTLEQLDGARLEVNFLNANRLLNVTVNGDLTLSSPSARVKIEGTTTFANAHLLADSSSLGFGPGAVLAGNVRFEGANTGTRSVEMNGTAGTLIIGPTGSIRTVAGFGGAAQVGSSSAFGGAMTLVNQGMIESTVSGRTITVSPTTLTNQGTLTASGGGTLTLGGAWSNSGALNVDDGTLNLGGTFTTAGLNLPAFSRTGGVVNLTGTLNNTGATLTLNAATSSWNLSGGTISGGTLAQLDGARLQILDDSNNRLLNVTVDGDLMLSADSAKLKIEGSTTFANAHLSGQTSALGFGPGTVLTGNVLFEGPKTLRSVQMNGTSGTLTIGPTGSIRSVAGFTTFANVGSGSIWGGQMTLVNQGTIESDGTNQTNLTVQPATFINQGTLSAVASNFLTVRGLTGNLGTVVLSGALSQISLDGTNYVNNLGLTAPLGTTLALGGTWSSTGALNVNGGTLLLGGTFTTAGLNLPAFSRTGGVVNLTGTLNNTGAILTMNAATGLWNLSGGTISGGTVEQLDGARLDFTESSNNRLLNVTVNGDLTLSAARARVKIEGSTTFANAHLIGSDSSLGFAPGTVLTGNVLFEGPSNGTRGVGMNGTSGTLTIGPTGSMRTAVGFGGGAQVGPSFLFGGVMALINQGTIESTVNGRNISVIPATLDNPGAMKATSGGTLTLGGGVNPTTLTNAGTVAAASGGTLTLGGAWSSTGAINVNGGTLNLGGTFTTAGLNLLAFSRTGGTVNLTGTLNNTGSTLALNAATGSWNLGGTIVGGTISGTAGSVITVTGASNPSTSGLLNGVTLNADLIVPANMRLVVTGGLTLNGAVTMQGRFDSNTIVEFSGTQTVSGTGQFVMTHEGGGSIQTVIRPASGSTLTIGEGITVHGGGGTASTNTAVGDTGRVVINQGTILADATGGALTLLGTITNQGTLSARGGGTLNVPSLGAHSGTIAARSGGLVNISGALTQTANAIITTEIGGTSTSQYGRIAVTGAATLAGTYTVSLVGGFMPVAGNTFSVLTYSSRSGDFTTVNGLSLPNGLVFNRTLGATSMTLTAAVPLLAASAASSESDQQLLQNELLAVNQVAIEIWAGMGLPQSLIDRLRSVELVIADIAGLVLATSVGTTITVDRNSAGHGWFVDSTAELDEEFSFTDEDSVLGAITGSQADGRMDLLSVLLHEQSHILGLEHAMDEAAQWLMSPTLSASTRRKLDASIIDQILANGEW